MTSAWVIPVKPLGMRYRLPVAAAIAAGPLTAGAEALGQFEAMPRPMIVYAFSAGFTVITSMLGVLMWFLKREHASITGGIISTREAVRSLTATTAQLALQLEQHYGQLQTEIAKRVLVSEHGRSSARLHDKLNRIDRMLAYMRAKIGLEELPGGESEPSADDDDQGSAQ